MLEIQFRLFHLGDMAALQYATHVKQEEAEGSMAMAALKMTDPNFPSEETRSAAREASRALSLLNGRGSVRVDAEAERGEKQHFVLPVEAVRLLTDVLSLLGEGRPVVVTPKDHTMTTQQAAELLNVSRPYVIRLIEQGKLQHQMVGTHRRILLHDLLVYKEAQDQISRSALDELTAEAQELDMGY